MSDDFVVNKTDYNNISKLFFILDHLYLDYLVFCVHI